jgi:predicted RNase H-like HicB family nuclease
VKIPYYIVRDPETGVYVAIAPSIPGAHTQADTLEELRENLKEVIELCLAELAPEERESLPEFVAFDQLEVIEC